MRSYDDGIVGFKDVELVFSFCDSISDMSRLG